MYCQDKGKFQMLHCFHPVCKSFTRLYIHPPLDIDRQSCRYHLLYHKSSLLVHRLNRCIVRRFHYRFQHHDIHNHWDHMSILLCKYSFLLCLFLMYKQVLPPSILILVIHTSRDRFFTYLIFDISTLDFLRMTLCIGKFRFQDHQLPFCHKTFLLMDRSLILQPISL